MTDSSIVPSSPVKEAIDSNSGRFEFLKQTLTLGSLGIAGIGALFTDPARIPSDIWSKIAVLIAGISLAVTVYYSVTGLSVYANLLTSTATVAAGGQPNRPVSYYVNGLLNHARGVVVALFISFIAIVLFAGYRLFFVSINPTPEAAIDAALVLASRATKQPPDGLYLTRLELENDTFVVTYFATASNSDVTVRVSRKGGNITRLVQDKRQSDPGTRRP
jgi:hypothetical protein